MSALPRPSRRRTVDDAGRPLWRADEVPAGLTTVTGLARMRLRLAEVRGPAGTLMYGPYHEKRPVYSIQAAQPLPALPPGRQAIRDRAHTCQRCATRVADSPAGTLAQQRAADRRADFFGFGPMLERPDPSRLLCRDCVRREIRHAEAGIAWRDEAGIWRDDGPCPWLDTPTSLECGQPPHDGSAWCGRHAAAVALGMPT